MKLKLGVKSYHEIMNQEKAWKSVLNDRAKYNEVVQKLKAENFDKVLFIGCGSSYYIALSGAFVFTKLTGIESQAVPASEIIFYPEVYLNPKRKTLVVAVSRSGKTTEVIKAIETIRDDSNVSTLGLTCYEESCLSQICDQVLYSRDGKEESVVMTKSFTSLLLALHFISGLWVEEEIYLDQLKQLGDYFRKNIELWRSQIETFVGENMFNKHEFLGQGNMFGLTNEAMLKMKEMSIVPSEDFHSLEFRHGPKSIVDEDMLIVMFVGERTFESEKKLARELVDYGAKLIIICNHSDDEIDELKQLVIELNTELDQFALTPLYLVSCQLFAYYTAVKKGIDVDHPRNLTHVVENI